MIKLAPYTFQILIVCLTMDIVNTIILILNEFDILIMTEKISCYKFNTMLQEIQNLLQKYVKSSSLIVHTCSYLPKQFFLNN